MRGIHLIIILLILAPFTSIAQKFSVTIGNDLPKGEIPVDIAYADDNNIYATHETELKKYSKDFKLIKSFDLKEFYKKNDPLYPEIFTPPYYAENQKMPFYNNGRFIFFTKQTIKSKDVLEEIKFYTLDLALNSLSDPKVLYITHKGDDIEETRSTWTSSFDSSKFLVIIENKEMINKNAKSAIVLEIDNNGKKLWEKKLTLEKGFSGFTGAAISNKGDVFISYDLYKDAPANTTTGILAQKIIKISSGVQKSFLINDFNENCSLDLISYNNQTKKLIATGTYYPSEKPFLGQAVISGLYTLTISENDSVTKKNKVAFSQKLASDFLKNGEARKLNGIPKIISNFEFSGFFYTSEGSCYYVLNNRNPNSSLPLNGSVLVAIINKDGIISSYTRVPKKQYTSFIDYMGVKSIFKDDKLILLFNDDESNITTNSDITNPIRMEPSSHPACVSYTLNYDKIIDKQIIFKSKDTNVFFCPPYNYLSNGNVLNCILKRGKDFKLGQIKID